VRFRNLLIGDIRFQIKYGFYFLYTLITIIYIIILSFCPKSYKTVATSVIIFTDPATLGTFFMGAIILLEKSERVLSSIAVSPVKIWEYIFSKVVSLSLISTLAGVVIALFSGTHSFFLTLIATFLGSVLFSLIGIIIASKTNSLNSFILTTVLVMTLLMLPALAELFGYTSHLYFLHPGNIILRLINGNTENILLRLIILLIWIMLFYNVAKKTVEKMMTSLSGGKL